MLTYGSQVNPSLGRQDFSSILQGAQARAQGTVQAAQTRAQSMANIGSQISEGFKTYVKNREQNSVLDGRIGRILSSRPELANDPELKPLFEERAKKGGLPLDKSQKLYSALETTLELDKAKQEQDARAIQMRVNNLQLNQMQQGFDEANRDREAFGKVYKAMVDAKKVLTPEETMSMAVFYGASPSGVAKLLGQSENSAEFRAKMDLVKAQTSQIAANNTQVLARTTRLDENQRLAPNGYRFFDAGDGARVLQVLDYETGGWKTEPLKAPATPASLALLEDKMKKTDTIFKEYTAILNSPERDTPEAVKRRNQLTEQYNVVNPKSDMQYNQTRENLDNLWGLNTPMTGVGAADAEGGKPAAPGVPTKSNIRGVSPAAPGAQPTTEPATAAAPSSLNVSGGQAAAIGAALMPNLNRAAPFASMGFNLVEDARRRLGAGQAATTPAIDTTVGAPAPAAPPPVDLNAPASISGVIPMGVAGMERGEGGDRGEPVKLSKDERNVLQRAMSILDKTQPSGFDYGYAGRPAGNRPESEGRLMALRAGFLPNINRAVPFASVAANAFEAMSPRAMGSSRAFSAPPAEEARAVSAAPQFLDREARATAAAMQPEMETPLPFERYQTPAQGPIPQIKLSPAAQKIASELRRSAQSGERGKAPQFFLEASTGDDGKRTRVKLDQNELFAILTNSRMPNLAPGPDVIDREESRRLMDQQMRMNELMRQYRPPPRRGR